MSFIQVSWQEMASRGKQVQRLLKPLAKQRDGPAWEVRPGPRHYIIGTHDGSPPTSSYRDWRFATFVPMFKAMYFEYWELIDDNFLSLSRSYLSIFRTDPSTRNEDEFLSLHCDPNERDDASHAVYKKGPHLHIQAAEDPIPRAHIALNRAHLDEVLSSADSLSKAIAFGVNMLKDEILEPLLQHGGYERISL